jgi:HK97 family phage prohead protease
MKHHKMTYAKSIDSEKKTISGYISTFAWDRDGERFVKGAWDFSNYLNNPVVLWSHDISQLPIAKNVALNEDEFGVLATSEFDQRSQKAQEIFSLFERKFLNAFSVGFMRKDFKIEDIGGGRQGLAITKAELFEYSAVSVPANPGALVGREIAELATKILGPKSIEKLKTKSIGDAFLVVPAKTKGPGDPEEPEGPKDPKDPKDPEASPAPETEILENPEDNPTANETEPESIPPPESQAEPKQFEPALKQVIELARMAKGNPVSETQKVLLTTALTVFNEIVEENRKTLTSAELNELKRVLVEFAGVTAEILPEAARTIQKTISQIEKAVTGLEV